PAALAALSLLLVVGRAAGIAGVGLGSTLPGGRSAPYSLRQRDRRASASVRDFAGTLYLSLCARSSMTAAIDWRRASLGETNSTFLPAVLEGPRVVRLPLVGEDVAGGRAQEGPVAVQLGHRRGGLLCVAHGRAA